MIKGPEPGHKTFLPFSFSSKERTAREPKNAFRELPGAASADAGPGRVRQGRGVRAPCSIHTAPGTPCSAGASENERGVTQVLSPLPGSLAGGQGGLKSKQTGRPGLAVTLFCASLPWQPGRFRLVAYFASDPVWGAPCSPPQSALAARCFPGSFLPGHRGVVAAYWPCHSWGPSRTPTRHGAAVSERHRLPAAPAVQEAPCAFREACPLLSEAWGLGTSPCGVHHPTHRRLRGRVSNASSPSAVAFCSHVHLGHQHLGEGRTTSHPLAVSAGGPRGLTMASHAARPPGTGLPHLE